MAVRRAAPILMAVALVTGLAATGSAGASGADCFADYGGTVAADEVVSGNLLVTRQTPGIDPMGFNRGSICLVEGTVQGNVIVIDQSEACRTRPPFTALELAGGTIRGGVKSTGNSCAMVWLRDGAWVGGTDRSKVLGDVLIEAPGNLGFLGSGQGAVVKGDALVIAPGSGLFATGASNTNHVGGDLICRGGAAAGGVGAGTRTNWDGLESPSDPGPDGTIGGDYAC